MRNIKGSRFQQRHYEAIADTFKGQKENVINKKHIEAWLDCVNGFVAMFKADNPKFNPEKFRAACGYYDYK